MMDIDSEHLGIPEQDYAVVCEMPASEFQKTCKDLTMFTDTLNVTATKAGIVFSGKGDNGQSAVTLEVTDPVNVNFSIKYMNQFTKASSLSSRVRISLSNDVPIVVEYPLTDDGKSTGQQNGHLRFYLAPKIDEEDNMD
ncbi:Proliferating cell nuclear antigen domain protein [Teladorsagia circumcincta]|uniref:Proliferating cell nuclear antigen domain protein n=1 Tax=Teladorsagia circumcincta TaxID=45464 RepID=A0A2G9T8E3_TELCI|nr:Proliferating cell nuclear antigen domain protein [Teladorsagia circumcincta]